MPRHSPRLVFYIKQRMAGRTYKEAAAAARRNHDTVRRTILNGKRKYGVRSEMQLLCALIVAGEININDVIKAVENE